MIRLHRAAWHIGYKFGGMSLDGEAPSDANAVDASHPWGETALTLDVFGFHGLSRIDNGTGLAGPVRQDDSVNAVGGVLRGQVGSVTLTTGAIAERHSEPYAGTAANAGAAPAVPGTPDHAKATVLTQFNEVGYVIYPWLIPIVRAEFIRLPLDAIHGGGSASLFRGLPGVAMLFRPNIRLTLLERLSIERRMPFWAEAALG
jgi:hypothetical protein